MSDPGPLPRRWINCPPKSNDIIVDKFIAFKTPLSAAFKPQLDSQNLFEPNMLFDFIKRLNLRLGLWIDLTNTNRFYDRKTIEAKGVQYIKLCCRGHGETPTMEQTQSFIEIVSNFINEQPFDLIGVHCTHGFNRTGFLIISYLIERLDFSVEAALATFAQARSPGIYKQDYINELYRRYDSSGEPPIAPELPDWGIEEDIVDFDTDISHNKRKRSSHVTSNLNDIASLNGINDSDNEGTSQTSCGIDGNSSNGNSRPKNRRRELVIKNAQFMEGVPGVEWVETSSVVSHLQKLVQSMCGFDDGGFPGAQPVSMDRDNIEKLRINPYQVSWKADGTR